MSTSSKSTNSHHALPTVMLLAAGQGTRMRPLTLAHPKPMLRVAGQPLLYHHLKRLRDLGFEHIVVNVDYLGEQIIDFVQSNPFEELSITVSDERPTGALETAGGILYALDKIETDPFLVINADIWCGLDYASFCARASKSLTYSVAYLGLVPNPPHNAQGDFYFNGESQQIRHEIQQGTESATATHSRFTFSGIGVYRKSMFADLASSVRGLAPVLKDQMSAGAVQGELLACEWLDIGTPERLTELDSRLRVKSPVHD